MTPFYYNPFVRFAYLIFSVAVAMVGYQIHHSTFWAIVNFFFAPVSVVWWLVFHEVNVSIIQHTFSFFNH